MPGKTPQEIMTCIAAMRKALLKQRTRVPSGSAIEAKIDNCLDDLQTVLLEIITQDLHTRTDRLLKLKDGLVRATGKLKKLKESIESVIAALNTVQAIVQTGTALLGVL